MSTSTTLERLMRACVDDERTLRREQKLVDGQRTVALARMARHRGELLLRLEDLAEHPRPPPGTWGDLAREAGQEVWVAVAGHNNGDSIATCRRSNARTEARYDDALRQPWPDGARALLEGPRAALEGERHELAQLQF